MVKISGNQGLVYIAKYAFGHIHSGFLHNAVYFFPRGFSASDKGQVNQRYISGGARTAMPSNRPSSSGIINPIVFAAPVPVGIIGCMAEGALKRSVLRYQLSADHWYKHVLLL